MSGNRKRKSEHADAIAPVIYREVREIFGTRHQIYDVHKIARGNVMKGKDKFKPDDKPLPPKSPPVGEIDLDKLFNQWNASYRVGNIDPLDKPLPSLTSILVPLQSTVEWAKFTKVLKEYGDLAVQLDDRVINDAIVNMNDFLERTYKSSPTLESALLNSNLSNLMINLKYAPSTIRYSKLRDDYIRPIIKAFRKLVNDFPPPVKIVNLDGRPIEYKQNMVQITANSPIYPYKVSVGSSKAQAFAPLFISFNDVDDAIGPFSYILSKYRYDIIYSLVGALDGQSVNLLTTIIGCYQKKVFEPVFPSDPKSVGFNLIEKLCDQILLAADGTSTVKTEAPQLNERLYKLKDEFMFPADSIEDSFNMNGLLPMFINRMIAVRYFLLQFILKIDATLSASKREKKLVLDWMHTMMYESSIEMTENMRTFLNSDTNVIISSTTPVWVKDDPFNFMNILARYLSINQVPIPVSATDWKDASEKTKTLLSSSMAGENNRNYFTNVINYLQKTCQSLWSNSKFFENNWRLASRYNISHVSWAHSNAYSILANSPLLLKAFSELHVASSSLTVLPPHRNIETDKFAYFENAPSDLFSFSPRDNHILKSIFGKTFPFAFNPILYGIANSVAITTNPNWWAFTHNLNMILLLQYFTTLLFACAEMVVYHFATMAWRMEEDFVVYSTHQEEYHNDEFLYVNDEGSPDSAVLKASEIKEFRDFYERYYLRSLPAGAGYVDQAQMKFQGVVMNSISGYFLGHSLSNIQMVNSIWQLFRKSLRFNLFNMYRAFSAVSLKKNLDDRADIHIPLCVSASFHLLFNAILPLTTALSHYGSVYDDFFGKLLASSNVSQLSPFSSMGTYAPFRFFHHFQDWFEDLDTTFDFASPFMMNKINATWLGLSFWNSEQKQFRSEDVSSKTLISQDIQNNVLNSEWLRSLVKYAHEWNGTIFRDQQTFAFPAEARTTLAFTSLSKSTTLLKQHIEIAQTKTFAKVIKLPETPRKFFFKQEADS
jgi:hypothetical protein